MEPEIPKCVTNLPFCAIGSFFVTKVT